MKSIWVTRDESNNIISTHGVEQYPDQEKLTDEHPEVIAFSAPRAMPPIEKARAEYPGFAELVEALAEERTGNPGKINLLLAAVGNARQKHGA